ncbi:MAG TPA: MarR family transcriptional regulator [Steroidobacteraceae bacterium]|nr:MarR family transcriptional regulator [Steroidobacteraceae bacterium]
MYAQRSPKSLALQRFERALAALQHDPVHCVHRHIARTARVVGARFDEALATRGFTSGQFTTLMTLVRMGPLPIGRLAEELAMDASTVPRVIRPLIERGWVELAHGKDRRVRIVAATDEGVQRLTDALPTWERTQVEALASLEAQGWKELRHGIASLRRGLRRTGAPARIAAGSGRV